MQWGIFEAKIKYDILDKSLVKELNNITLSNNVNIIIDLKQIYRKMFRNSVELDSNDPNYLTLETERITSDIIGIISHYRNYFYKNKKYTKFYFLYSESECELFKAIYPDYKKEYYDKYFNGDNIDKIDLIKRVNAALKVVINLIPNCTYINTSDFDELVYAAAITSNSINELNLVLTNDETFFQLINNNTYCLNLHGNASEIIKPDNFYKNILENNSLETNLTHKIFRLILALAGVKKLSINGINKLGLNRAYCIIKSFVDDNTLYNNEYLINPFSEEKFNNDNKYSNKILENIELLKQNFEVLNYNKYLNENKIMINNKIFTPRKIVSMNTFIELNQRVFRTYPLNVTMLIKGELI